jgi:hypothetical protein
MLYGIGTLPLYRARYEDYNMDQNQIDSIKQKLAQLKSQMINLGPCMRGSVVIIGSGSKPKKPFFSLNKNKKTHLIYLGQAREARARLYSQNYHDLCQIIDEMTLLYMELLKANVDF